MKESRFHRLQLVDTYDSSMYVVGTMIFPEATNENAVITLKAIQTFGILVTILSYNVLSDKIISR